MNEIQSKIARVILQFFLHPWTSKDFLTEDDVRCRLFLELKNALDANENISVHSEVRWYGKDPVKKLKYRSDLVVIDNANLTVEGDMLPSKGYVFDGYHSIIEIKLRRINNKQSDKAYEDVVEEDAEKLREIRANTNRGNYGSISYYVLTFDKKSKRKSLIGDVDFSKNVEWQQWDC